MSFSRRAGLLGIQGMRVCSGGTNRHPRDSRQDAQQGSISMHLYLKFWLASSYCCP